jgi:hypothetical protein
MVPQQNVSRGKIPAVQDLFDMVITFNVTSSSTQHLL